MYPFACERPYIRNAWYIAAWSDEVGRAPRARTIMDDPIVFFRTEQGAAVAMWGLCAHRHHPLEYGTVVCDAIRCPYHGFTYDQRGACVFIPAQAKTPDQFRQRTYPLIERGGLLWIWMGDPAQADAALMPDLAEIGFESPEWRVVTNGVTNIAARWSIIIDNVMDLSHVGFLHLSTIEAPDAADAVPQNALSDRIEVVRWMTDQNPDTPYYRHAFPGNDRPLDIEMGSVFHGPALVVTYFKFYTAASLGPRVYIGMSNHLHGVTPESRGRSHDFSGVVRNVRIDSAEFDAWLRDAVNRTREEDVVALERIEPLLDRHADARTELSGVGDLGPNRVRRRLAAMLLREDETATGQFPPPVV